jgi:pimeloyl-ACP methyl ester carboxylesterase
MRISPARGASLAVLAVACLVPFATCSAARLHSKPGDYEVTRKDVAAGPRKVEATYVSPVHPRHPGELLVFATGDGGWRGLSADLFEHLAGLGYFVAGYSAPETIRYAEKAQRRISTEEAATELAEIFAQAKKDLGLPPATPIVVVGYSRGATMVAFTALSRRLRGDVRGAVAIALTREADYLRAPAQHAELQVDDRGRIQLYPALSLLGSTPFAVIQSTHDRYVPAAESRRLLGADTEMRRLYEIEARNHGFGGARDELLLTLDEALEWVQASVRAAAAE